MRYVTAASLFLLVFSACSPKKVAPVVEIVPEEETVTIVEESPDTVDIVIEVKSVSPEKRIPEEKQETMGYKFSVQIAALSSKEGADSFKRKAEGKIKESVFVEYESPYYKVRVGRYEDRKDAEIARNSIRKFYPEAFIVSK